MDSFPVLARFLTYGWLAGDQVTLSPSASDGELLLKYVGSPSFQTSFLPSDVDENGIHGPFVAEMLAASDYEPLIKASLIEYIDALFSAPEWDPPPTREEVSRLRDILWKAFEQDSRCFVLRFDEESARLHHEWGMVFTVFREFLFIGDCPSTIFRYVIGYD